jgi:hypothetical protein
MAMPRRKAAKAVRRPLVMKAKKVSKMKVGSMHVMKKKMVYKRKVTGMHTIQAKAFMDMERFRKKAAIREAQLWKEMEVEMKAKVKAEAAAKLKMQERTAREKAKEERAAEQFRKRNSLKEAKLWMEIEAKKESKLKAQLAAEQKAQKKEEEDFAKMLEKEKALWVAVEAGKERKFRAQIETEQKAKFLKNQAKEEARLLEQLHFEEEEKLRVEFECEEKLRKKKAAQVAKRRFRNRVAAASRKVCSNRESQLKKLLRVERRAKTAVMKQLQLAQRRRKKK